MTHRPRYQSLSIAFITHLICKNHSLSHLTKHLNLRPGLNHHYHHVDQRRRPLHPLNPLPLGPPHLRPPKQNPLLSCYVLDLTALQHPSISVYSAWEGQELLGCGALKELSPTTGEIKSMRTATAHLRKGVGRAIVQHIIDEAKGRGYVSLSLETGTDESFRRAREF